MSEYKKLSPVTGADGIFQSWGDCLRSTEALLRYCRNSHPRARNFHLYRLLVIVSYHCISFLEIKIRTNGFNVCVVVYEFMHSFINFQWCHLTETFIHEFSLLSFKARESSYTVGCKMNFLALVKTAEIPVWYARITNYYHLS